MNPKEAALINTARRFLAKETVEKLPYGCPVCGVTCVYTVTPIGIITSYTREPCECEQENERRENQSILEVKEREYQRNLAHFKKKSRLTGALERMTFEHLAPRPELTEPIAVAHDFINCYPSINNGYILSGNPGSGKTHILAATLHKLIEAGHRGELWTGTQILDAYKNSYSGIGIDPTEHLCKIPILAYDEVGGENISDRNRDWAQERILNIINCRCNLRTQSVSTLMTTNCSPAEIGLKLGDRTLSRIFEMAEWVEVKSSDYRIYLQKKARAERISRMNPQAG